MKQWLESSKKRFLNKMIVMAIPDGTHFTWDNPELLFKGTKTEDGEFRLFSIYEHATKNFYSWEETINFAKENDMVMMETNVVTIFSILNDLEKYLKYKTDGAYMRPYNKFQNEKNMCIYEEQTKL